MTTDAMTLCVINYNGERHLKYSLGAARQSRLRFAELLLVDNGSDDRSRELVEACYPEVRVLPLDRNEGPAAARNAGFRAAQHDLILFIDNDVAPAPDCASQLQAALAGQPGALAAMPRVVHADRPDRIQFDGAGCHYLGHMILRHAGLSIETASVQPAESDSMVTACFLIDRRAWRGGEPFDPSFIFNYEDHDFGVRSRLLGHTLLSIPEATCRHGSGTPGLSFREDGERAPLRVFCLLRNRWRIILQCYAGRTLVLLAPMLLMFEAVQLAGMVGKGWGMTWLRAAAWMTRHIGMTLVQRREIQRARRTPDREILRGGPLPFTPTLLTSRMERAAYAAMNGMAQGYWRLVERWL
jgi:GT2 family glycosyltransferase